MSAAAVDAGGRSASCRSALPRRTSPRCTDQGVSLATMQVPRSLLGREQPQLLCEEASNRLPTAPQVAPAHIKAPLVAQRYCDDELPSVGVCTLLAPRNSETLPRAKPEVLPIGRNSNTRSLPRATQTASRLVGPSALRSPRDVRFDVATLHDRQETSDATGRTRS